MIILPIPQKIKDLANEVRTAKYGKDVRESIAQSMEETGDTADQAYKITQNLLDESFDQGLLNTEIELRMDNLYTTKGQKLDDLHDAEKLELDALQQEYADKAQNLETTYAPRLTSAEQKIDQNHQQVTEHLAESALRFSNLEEIVPNQIIFASRSNDGFLGDAMHQAYATAVSRVAFPRVEMSKGVTMENNDGTFRISSSGLYLIMCKGQIERGSGSFRPYFQINSAYYTKLGDYGLNSNVDVSFNGSVITRLNANDTVELWIELLNASLDYKFPLINFQILKIMN